MSRIGKVPIVIPAGVKVHVADGVVRVNGPKGTLEHQLAAGVAVDVGDGTVQVGRADDSRAARSRHGLTQRLVANMVQGVHTGFAQTLEIVGVGYRAEARGQALVFSLGYSHPILFQLRRGSRHASNARP